MIFRVIAFTSLAAVAASVPLSAWGYDAHKYIVERAIPLLPSTLRPLFEANRAVVVEHSIDPDLWRELFGDEEGPNHYLDYDAEGYGPYPFAALPRDYDDAVKKFGKAHVDRYGRIPWRVEEVFGRLKDSFAAYERRGSFGRYDILFYSSWLAHYVGDSHVPFHAVVDSDGQRTGQRGIHTRFESLMFERYRSQLRVAPVAIAPIRNPRDFTFDVLRVGTTLVPGILDADRQAIGDREIYDDRYYEAFFRSNRAVLERRLAEASAAVAAMIAGAWEAAGKPEVPVSARDGAERRRK